MESFDDWGGDLPNRAISSPPQPVPGTINPDRTIACQGCLKDVPNNSEPGLKPSCPNCWAAIDIVGETPRSLSQ